MITTVKTFQWPNGSTSEFNSGGSRSFPVRRKYILLFNSNVLNFLLKTNVGRNRRPNFVIFVIWSA